MISQATTCRAHRAVATTVNIGTTPLPLIAG
jgi:hypothetical protein